MVINGKNVLRITSNTWRFRKPAGPAPLNAWPLDYGQQVAIGMHSMMIEIENVTKYYGSFAVMI